MRIAILFAVACSGAAPRPNVYVPAGDTQLARSDLTPNETRLLGKHGFVIAERGAVTSFHAGYTALFHDHKPVYVTADSILYAWHSSYDQILFDLEQQHLVPTMNAMLVELRKRLRDSKALAQTRADLDVYLTAAISFAEGKLATPVAGGDLGVITEIFEQGQSAKGETLRMFEANRQFDFSMLQPRGHYAVWPEMQQYFRAMSWLGRAEIEIAYKRKKQDPWTVDRRALRAAVLLGELSRGAPRDHWNVLDATIGAFVGPHDSMSLDGLAKALAKINHNPDAPDADVIAAFAAPSVQQIRTQLAHAGAESHAFVTLGQRFVFDSKVFSDLTYGSLQTEPKRLMPMPLDVAHAVFHNPAAGPLLDGERKKYGPTYAKALDAIAKAPRDPALWEGSLYHGWLGALRELSPDPDRDAAMPAPLASDAWARRMMAAQLASWAELRHDNLLYAKQSLTATIECAYPDGYVEPYPTFFAAMHRLALRGRAVSDALPFKSKDQNRVGEYFVKMAVTMDRLRAIAERERANQELLGKDLEFLNRMVSIDGSHGGCGGPAMEPSGWYSDLYFDRTKVLSHDAVIADVHTQPDDASGSRVGHVLHVGTRAPRMLVARLQHDRGKNAQTYRGFVSTYAETVTRDFRRYTDEQWRAESGAIESTPAWLRSITAR